MYNQTFFDYIYNNLSANPKSLILRDSGKAFDFPLLSAITQIECRQKTRRKLSSFISNPHFFFPSTLSAEQATHQCVSRYHSELFEPCQKIIDITAGLGIDAFTFASAQNEVYAFELDKDRADALNWNKEILNIANIKVYNGDSIQWIHQNLENIHFDILFADPARRDSYGNKTYFLRDCQPDLLTVLDSLKSIADKIYIKASPILDLTNTIKEVPDISEIHIVCIKGECKEILIICSKEPQSPLKIVVADLEENYEASVQYISRFSTCWESHNMPVSYFKIKDLKIGLFLYDPNAGIHKLGCPGVICEAFPKLQKLSRNTDLFISDTLYENFPGRRFMIEEIITKKDFKNYKNKRRDVIVRNYPITAVDLSKKLKVESDTDNFIIGCRIGAKEVPTLLDVSKI